MIPKLRVHAPVMEDCRQYLEDLARDGFQGDIRTDLSSRLVAATDNSIYQVLPQAVVFPKSTDDVVILFKLARRDFYSHLTFSPRGGGTGTNGQSLTPGIIIDCSKYMREVLEINVEERWVRVQPGVILDQLNAELKPHGLFFAPALSPSNRATLGGMMNTDACGKGSRVYGRTSTHVLGMTTVLVDGSVCPCEPLDSEALTLAKDQPGTLGEIHRVVDDIVTTKADLIEEVFPKMDRFLTGYNLAKVYDDEGRFHLDQLICGSEGSLAVVTEARLNLLPIPEHKGLVAVMYPGFNEALADAMALLSTEPAAIETIDDKILELARGDEIWFHIKGLVGKNPEVRTINLVEYVGHSHEEVQEKMARLSPEGEGRLDCYATFDNAEIKVLWDLRKKGVGLLGNMPGDRKPIAFVEDTAVPPHNLAAYIREFRALLREHDIDFAMYGHVDVGCLHVRPALDMQDPLDEQLVRKLSDEVVALVQKYGGVMWAEHGKGFRSEYTPLFFGEELHRDLRRIKGAFDPAGRLNPGKVVLPDDMEEGLVKVEAPLKGHFDRQIAPNVQAVFAPAIGCNGNGQCFNYEPTSVMCPSSKITRDRIHSPKGRAALMREWLRLLSRAAKDPLSPVDFSGEAGKAQDTDLPDEFNKPAPWLTRQGNMTGSEDDFSHEVYAAMSGCLSCKACSTQCPIHVDIPDFKARFIHRYHTRYPRPLRDYLVGRLESNLPLQARFAGLVNFMTGLLEKQTAERVGLVNPPRLSTPTMRQEKKRRGLADVTPETLRDLDAETRARSVVLIPDSFNGFYDTPVLWAAYDLLDALGFNVYLAPWKPNGKPLHVKGFLEEFREVAALNAETYRALAKYKVPLICVEPSIALTYRDEYSNYLGKNTVVEVHLIQEWLAGQKHRLKAPEKEGKRYALLGHCMEKTAVPDSQQQWQQIFAALGCELDIVPTGCCGMAGTYGHEIEHQKESKGIFDLSWAQWFDDTERAQRLLVTGYSCRTQAARFAGAKPKHPVQALLAHLGN
ncbi:MAG: FAD-binding and (Fe-S)-binding domain-containing protein [Acidobacteriota bacterium]|nr:FAD-binding and (Fe-S)-binding domain-containing protein [Acidobacteriota bacterium]